MNIRQRKKLVKKNKIFYREVIGEIIDYYDLISLLETITNYFVDNYDWTVNIAYTDFRQVHGTFPEDNIDTYSARYYHEYDIIEFNISANNIQHLRSMYQSNPAVIFAITLDLLIHEWCHKIDYRFETKKSITDKMGVLKKSDTIDEKYLGDHSERFKFIYAESKKVLNKYLEDLELPIFEITVSKVGSKEIHTYQALEIEA